jgi:hypothetical protein
MRPSAICIILTNTIAPVAKSDAFTSRIIDHLLLGADSRSAILNWYTFGEMESENEKSVEIPAFDGKYKNFQVWWICFMAYAMMNKFEKALKIGGERSMTVTETRTINTRNAGKIQPAAMKRNSTAMANLT